jgi:hypothetical protein
MKEEDPLMFDSAEAAAAFLVEAGFTVIAPDAGPGNWRAVYELGCEERERNAHRHDDQHSAALEVGSEAAIRLLESNGFTVDAGTLRGGRWAIRDSERTIVARGKSFHAALTQLIEHSPTGSEERTLVESFGQCLYLAALLVEDPGWLARAVLEGFSPAEASLVLGDGRDEDDEDGEDEDDGDEDSQHVERGRSNVVDLRGRSRRDR